MYRRYNPIYRGKQEGRQDALEVWLLQDFNKKRAKGKNTPLGTAKSMLIVMNQGSSFRSIQKGF